MALPRCRQAAREGSRIALQQVLLEHTVTAAPSATPTTTMMVVVLIICRLYQRLKFYSEAATYWINQL